MQDVSESKSSSLAMAELPTAGPTLGSYREIFKLAGPMMLSSMGMMLMQFVSALFLSWYSEEAVAAVVPASMSAYVVIGLFHGVANYTSTFVAQYVGAGRPERASAAVWQGLYFALIAGAGVACLAFLAEPLFRLAGHAPAIEALEARYFEIMCWGAWLALIASAFSGFFAGRGDTRVLMLVQLFAFAINIVLDYGLIFGRLGLPECGLTGAAISTVVAQGVIAVLLGVLFFQAEHRRNFGTWSARGFDRDLFRRLARFGFPNGARFVVEILAWTIFLFFVGRLGQTELAATGIVWRINGFTFVPAFGLASAIATLVGQAQGCNRPEEAMRCTYRGLLLGEIWMLAGAAIFLLFPRELFGLFRGESASLDPVSFERSLEMGVVLLRFVALYCLLDAFNIILMGALQGAGDTKWTLGMSLVLHLGFFFVMLALDKSQAGLNTYWAFATAFVMLQAFVWLLRFRSGHWKRMRVIETAPEEAVAVVL